MAPPAQDCLSAFHKDALRLKVNQARSARSRDGVQYTSLTWSI